jgi:pimeloyl-ACP methyl ester carboxylesterase
MTRSYNNVCVLAALLISVALTPTNDSVADAFLDCEGGPVPINHWCIRDSQGYSVGSSYGEFPGTMSAALTLAKAYANPCGLQGTGFTQHRYARVVLSPNVEYGVTANWTLNTWDFWDGEGWDVFYLNMNPQAFLFSYTNNMGDVSCGETRHDDGSETAIPGLTWWWGGDLVCPSSPCVITGATSFKYGDAESSQPLFLQAGLRTGQYWISYGSFTITVTPLRVELVDPQGTEFLIDGQIVPDPARFASAATTRSGVAADGVTQVLVRHRVPGPGSVEFKLEDEYGDTMIAEIGSLRAVGGSGEAGSLTVAAEWVAEDEQWWAFAIYTSPLDFVRLGLEDADLPHRPLKVIARFTPAGESEEAWSFESEFRIVRPPVVLVHGLWSDPGTWAWGELPDHFLVEIASYVNTHAASFAANSEVVRYYVSRAVDRVRVLQNIACTQSDVVGHSMGGVLARLYVTGYNNVQYKRSDNFNKGDIHKLITIAAPHQGAMLADILLSVDLRAFLARFVLAIAGKSCISGAVADLRTTSYANSVWLAQHSADVWAHSIAGVGGSHLLNNPGDLNDPSLTANDRHLFTMLRFFNLADEAFGGDLHDGIVTRTSARGNLVGDMTQDAGFVQYNWPGIHSSLTRESRSRILVRARLNNNLQTGYFAPEFPAQTIPSGWGGSSAVGELVSGLEIVVPAPDTVIEPGDNVVVLVNAIEGFVPEAMLIFCNYDAVIVDHAPFIATLAVPIESLGALSVAAIAYDVNGDWALSDTVGVQIETEAELIGLSVSPDELHFSGLLPNLSVTVTGLFSDDVPRDLTSSALGTTYVVDDASVAAVSPDGLVTAIGLGDTFVTAWNGGFSADVAIYVTGLPCPADLNSDGSVDIFDLLILLGAWGQCGACAADLNFDGVVDVFDLLALQGAWGACPGTTSLMALSFEEMKSHAGICESKWDEYIDVALEGLTAETACYACWAFRRFHECANLCPTERPECGCPDPFAD